MSDNKQMQVSRRDILLGAGMIAGLAATGSSFASTAHHHHNPNPNGNIIDSALHCMKTGQACLSHCMTEFKDGNVKMANCASSVQEMLAMCGTLSSMASMESKHLSKVAAACIDVCDACIEECDKHAKKHDTCKECRDACKDCVKEMKKII